MYETTENQNFLKEHHVPAIDKLEFYHHALKNQLN